MAVATAFELLRNHPAPGLHFPPHRSAGVGEYILPAPHRFGRPAGRSGHRVLRRLTRAAGSVQGELLEFYERWNGVDLCCLPDPLGESQYCPGLTIFPVEQWRSATGKLTTGSNTWILEDVRGMYAPGSFIAIGGYGSEGTRLVLFTKGQLREEALAGKMFCVAVDPVMGYTEELAGSFELFLEEFAADPAKFLDRIGFCHHVTDGRGQVWGAVPDRYIPDIRGMEDLIGVPGARSCYRRSPSSSLSFSPLAVAHRRAFL